MGRRVSISMSALQFTGAVRRASILNTGKDEDDDTSAIQTTARLTKLAAHGENNLGFGLQPRKSVSALSGHRRNKRLGSNIGYMENVCLEPPPLTTSYRAHTMGITSIAINESRNIIITGSTDCSVRIWTMCGRYIGTLGQKHNWAMDESVLDLSKLPQIIPEDVRRVASANTLRTVKGGVHTQWKMVKNALAFLRLDIGKGNDGENAEKNVEEGVKLIKTPFGIIKKKIEKKPEDKPAINLETQKNG